MVMDEWKQQVQRNGFALLPTLFSHQEVAQYIQHFESLTPVRSRAGVRHAMRYLPVQRLAGDHRLLQLALAILGPKAFPYRATLFDKSRGSNWLVVWHQDTALPLARF